MFPVCFPNCFPIIGSLTKIKEKMINTTIVFNHRGEFSKDGTAPIEVRITIHRKAYYISTGVRVRKKEWKFGKVVNRSDCDDMNERVDAMFHRVNKLVNESVRKNLPLEVKKIRKQVYSPDMRSTNDPEDMLSWCSSEIEKLNVADGTRKHYRTSVARLIEFGEMRKWTDLSVENLHRYDAYLHSIKLHRTDAEKQQNKPEKYLRQATIRNHHKDFRALLSRAYEFGIIAENPYNRMRGDIKRGDEERIEFLTTEERDRIEALTMNGDSMLATVRDIFIFQCYTGMAYSDAMAFSLDKCQQDGDKLTYSAHRVKTGVTFYIRVLPKALEIVQKYGGRLPNVADQTCNANLKTIANVTGITKRLTTHVGRHTFATWMLRIGVPLEHVQKMLGHRRITQTQRYAKLLPMDVYGQFDRVMSATEVAGTERKMKKQ